MNLIEQLRTSNYKYSPTVVRDLLKSNRSRYGYVRPETKKIIFFMMRRIVLKDTAKYFGINKQRNNDVVEVADDIVNELYIVLSNCCDKFDTDSGKDFYLYFNSAAARRIARLANYKRVNNGEMTFSKLSSYISEDGVNIESNIDDISTTDHTFENVVWSDIANIELTEQEITLLNCLYSTDKTKDVVKSTGMTRSEIKQVRTTIQEKINTTYL